MKIHVKDTKRASKNRLFPRQTVTGSVRLELSKTNEIQMY